LAELERETILQRQAEGIMAAKLSEEIKTLDLSCNSSDEITACWTEHRYLVPKETTQPFLFFRSVETKNEKKIILDNYNADITLMTAIVSGNQMNTLACMMEQLLTDKESDSEELTIKVEQIAQKMFGDSDFEIESLLPDTAGRWYEEIRPVDAFCCANRMRGLHFSNQRGGDAE
jgi:hypothetical protein